MNFRSIFLAILLVLMSTSVYAGGLLNGLFGGRRNQVATISCNAQQVYQPTYQQAYYQPYQYQQYQAVAAIPLATIPVAVDLQAYMYSVNANAFQSFRDYMNTKSTVQQEQPALQPTHQQVANQQATQAQSDDPRALGLQVLGKSCKSCHSGATPKGGFSIFDARGSVLASLPWGKMIERISSPDPETRMPPGKSLKVDDILAIVKMASPPTNMVYNPSELGGSPVSSSPREKVAFRSPFE
jgi:mono/diheme cytochrome c family protein